jgi:hypothetical protein
LFKSTIKNITIIFSSLATALMVCQTANAGKPGLNVGAPVNIPPGQERQLLQYQLQNNKAGLRQMRLIPGCVTGFGLTCNKTGGVIEQIIQSNGGPTYQQMLMRAAGGEANFNRFTPYYGNNLNQTQQPIPYISVWRDGSNNTLDSVTYTLGQPLSRNRVPGLGDVTSKFYWSPLKGEDPYRGFVNLKYSFGRVLVEEAAKIPDLNQQMTLLKLEPEMMRFYLNNINRAINAIRTGRNEELKQSILTILSRPYSPLETNDGWFGREKVQLPESLIQNGDIIPPDILTDIAIGPPGSERILEVVELPGEEFFASTPDGSPWFPHLVGLGLLALLFLIGGDDSASARSTSTVGTTGGIDTPDYVCPDLNIGGGSNTNTGQAGEVQCEVPTVTPPEVRKVVEPSTIKAVILLALILCLVSQKKRQVRRLT